MDVETVSVNPVSANAGGTVASEDSNFVATFDEKVLDSNGSVFVKSDPAAFQSKAMNQQDLGQIGDAYNFEGYGANIRSGYTAEVTFSYNEDDIVDANEDGTVDASDEELLNVATVDRVNEEFDFNNVVVDKSIDTDANEVNFTIDDLSGKRYTLVLQNANEANSGTMTVDNLWFDDQETGVYTTKPTSGGFFSVIVSDPVGNVVNNSARLWIDGTNIGVQSANVLSSNEAVKFRDAQIGGTDPIAGLDLQEGMHTARFTVENDNGNRVDRTTNFIVDDSQPVVRSQTDLVGKDPSVTFIAQDPAIGDTTGSGLDESTVFVDVYATQSVETDTAGVVEIEKGIVRLSPDELSFTETEEGMEVSFSLVDNLDDLEYSGLELVVLNANDPRAPDFNGSGRLASFDYPSSDGVRDRAGNEGSVANFRVTSDKQAPELEVVSRTIESGVRVRATDSKAGIDSSSVTATETIGGETTELETSYNEDTGVVSFTPSEPGVSVSLAVNDNAGNTGTLDLVAESEALAVTGFHNFPNPFDPTQSGATLTFTLSRDAAVTIEAYDQAGRLVRTLVNGESMSAGEQEMTFQGRSDGGDMLSNGVYFLRIVAKDGDRQTEETFKSVIAK